MARFKNIIKWLATFYRVELTDENILAYYMKFKDVEEERFKKACNKAVDVCKFFPSVMELKEILEDIPSSAMQIERKKYYIGDWDNPQELPPHEEIERELQEILKGRKNG